MEPIDILFSYYKRFCSAGNAFIVNVALADLLVTSILMPASTIVLLAGIEEPLAVCRVQWFFAACAFLVTILSLAVSTSVYKKISRRCHIAYLVYRFRCCRVQMLGGVVF